MLNGYDNPDPTPRVPITRSPADWNKQWPKPGRDKVRPVKPFSERVADWIDNEEARDQVPRHTSFIVIPQIDWRGKHPHPCVTVNPPTVRRNDTIWQKMGNRTFYRLYGLNYLSGLNADPETCGIQTAITRAHSRVFIKDSTYPVFSNISPKTGIRVEGETSKGTILQAAANSLKFFTVGGAAMTDMRFFHLGMDANGQTGLTGYDLNMSPVEGPMNNWLFDLSFFNTVSGGFTNLIDMTGNEESTIDLTTVGNTSGQGYGEVILLVGKFAGWAKISRVFYSQPAGTVAGLHASGGKVTIRDCVLNTLIIDNQNPGDYNTSSISVMDTYLGNGQPVAKIQNGAVGTQGTALVMFELRGCYVSLANARAFLQNNVSRTMTIYRVHVAGCTVVNADASGVTWISQPSGTQATVFGGELFWSPGNYQTGTILEGSIMTGGYGQYYFEPPPAGWGWKNGGGWGTGANTPAVPVGTGIGNAFRNRSNRPIMIYQVGAVGTHIIDAEGTVGSSAVDAALGVDPTAIQLNPFEQVYYATTVPSSWKFYGL